MIPKMWERIILKWRKSYIGGGSKLAGKKGQFSTGIFSWISKNCNGGNRNQQNVDNTLIYERRPNETYEEYLASMETPEE